MDRTLIRRALLRILRNRPGEAMLIGMAIATLAIIAFIKPTRESESQSTSQNAQLANGWVTNCTGPAFARSSHGGNSDPGPDRPVFKINDQLVLAVPQNNLPSANKLESEPHECKSIRDLPKVVFLSFVVSGNWSASDKSTDIPVFGDSQHSQVDVATVRIEREMPELRSAEELQKLDQSQRSAQLRDSIGTRDVGGLTCLLPKPALVWFYCSGRRTPADPDITRLTYREYTGTPFILVLSDYISTRYGIHVYWKAWISDVSHALDVDRAIWNSIEEWHLVHSNDDR